MDRIFPYLALVTACAGAWTDLRTHKIYNRLIMMAIGTGFILRLTVYGGGGIVGGLAGFCMGTVFFPLWILGALKAGDIKLYMAIGVLGGWRFCLNAAVYSILLGGIAGLFFLAARKNGRQVLKHLWLYFAGIFMTGNLYKYQGTESSYFCFGICIAGGTLAALFKQII